TFTYFFKSVSLNRCRLTNIFITQQKKQAFYISARGTFDTSKRAWLKRRYYVKPSQNEGMKFFHQNVCSSLIVVRRLNPTTYYRLF
ncbi:hypothetical protein, partial [Vibrio splendidus]|uniref:hypothetical protein n=1 Tax=Vibrio splendidus TaxID=29497 RepID=UPI003D13F9A1